ncbi:uncharacterized protein [Diabrotica undecimpunctata]|uniref:uncharacterized protein n=1 Tax=Diabrotica undecimpunctata TaxID=50387 RepID=UPI003B633583
MTNLSMKSPLSDKRQYYETSTESDKSSLPAENLTIDQSVDTGTGGDFNGHMSRKGAGIKRVCGGLRIGIRNKEENSLIDFAVALDLAVINAFFRKTEDHCDASGRGSARKKSVKGPPIDKEIWWWNDEVQHKGREKKEARKRYARSKKKEDKSMYKAAKREEKCADRSYAQLYEELETPERLKRLYSIAKVRDEISQDLTHIRQIKSADGRVLRSDVQIKRRWYEYFRMLLNEELKK